jgi:hypothetical protein
MLKLMRLKMLPWLLLFEAAQVLRSHLIENLPSEDRKRVVEVVRRSKGDPRKVTAQEREDLRRIAAGLDLLSLGSHMLPIFGRATRRGRRR